MELKNTKISIGQITNSENAEAIAAQADKIGIGLYSLDRYPIVGNEQNGFAFGLGMIRDEQIEEAIRCLANQVLS